MASETAAVLARMHRDLDGVEPEKITFRTWIPQGVRRSKLRLFVESLIDGVAHYVAKVHLDPADTMVAREWSILSSLVAHETPRPRAVAEISRGFVMSYVPARDFPDVFRTADTDRQRTMLLAGVEAAAALHTRHGRLSEAGAAEAAARYLPGLIGLGEGTLRHLEKTHVGPAHGDMGPWNLRVDDHGRIGLIDWEDFRPVGLPALDVLNLVLTTALLAFPDYQEHGWDWLYERVFHSRNAFRSAAGHALERYAMSTGTDKTTILGLVPLFCRAMIQRIEDQGRTADHLFYRPFAERFEAEGGRLHTKDGAW
ncbi:phosphotransferase [Streptomyces collinus]|uniref:phosphotransferase n=1 Tax=Streptomyces collinus TaxID=42684 RepID=UPI00368A424F